MVEGEVGSRSEQDVLRGLERLESHATLSRDGFAQIGRS